MTTSLDPVFTTTGVNGTVTLSLSMYMEPIAELTWSLLAFCT